MQQQFVSSLAAAALTTKCWVMLESTTALEDVVAMSWGREVGREGLVVVFGSNEVARPRTCGSKMGIKMLNDNETLLLVCL